MMLKKIINVIIAYGGRLGHRIIWFTKRNKLAVFGPIVIVLIVIGIRLFGPVVLDFIVYLEDQRAKKKVPVRQPDTVGTLSTINSKSEDDTFKLLPDCQFLLNKSGDDTFKLLADCLSNKRPKQYAIELIAQLIADEKDPKLKAQLELFLNSLKRDLKK